MQNYNLLQLLIYFILLYFPNVVMSRMYLVVYLGVLLSFLPLVLWVLVN